MRLKLSQIKIDGDTQSREKIDQETVNEYTQLVMDKVEFPPVEVFFDGIDYYLVDGYHRYFAHKAAVVPDIEVKVTNGTHSEAQKYSFGVNDKHGLKRNNADKRKAVLRAFRHEECSSWSDREIANICNVSKFLVAKIRKDLGEEKTERKFVNKHGTETVMNTSNISKSNTKEPKKSKKEPEPEVEPEIDTEYDKVHELELVNKDLAEEIEALNDKLAVASIGSDSEEKDLAQQTIAELRERVRVLEQENDALKSSLATKMNQNADMVKQLNYYRKRVEKLEKAAA